MSKKKKKEYKEITTGVEAFESIEYTRTRWKHYFRWLVFGFIMMLYLMLLLTSYKQHILLHRGFILQELVGYIVCTLMMGPVLLSLVLEVDYIKIDPEELVLQNLLLRRRERWENISKFYNPPLLKFAIMFSKRFVYLLNRRDIPQFGELVDTIKQKAFNLQK